MQSITFSFTNLDYLLLVLGAIFAAFFTFVWWDKIYKCYFWIIIGFLLFQLVNQEITILSINSSGKILTSYEKFLQKNSDFMLTSFTLLVPLLWIFFTINSSIEIRVRGNIFWYVAFWFLLPFLILWISAYILVNAAFHLVFLQDILRPLSPSFFYNFFQGHLHYVFLFIFFFLFYRIMWEITFRFFIRAIQNIIANIKEKLWKKVETIETRHHEEEAHDEHHHDKHHDDHHSWHGHH